jgi:small conductance mechanosensitive channel
MVMIDLLKIPVSPALSRCTAWVRNLLVLFAFLAFLGAASGLAVAQSSAERPAATPAETATPPAAAATPTGQTQAPPAASPENQDKAATPAVGSDKPASAAPASPAAPAETAEARKEIAAARDALVQVLQDPVGRAALVGLLEGLGKSGAVGQSAQPGTAANGGGTAGERALSGQISDFSRQAFGDIASVFNRISVSLKGLKLLFTGQIQVKWDKVREIAAELSVVLGVALSTYWLLRFGGRFGATWLVRRFGARGWMWRVGLLIGLGLADLAAIFLALIVSVLVAGTLHIETLGGDITLVESLTLDAFLAAGVSRVMVRLLLSPDHEAVRLVPFSTASARYWAIRVGNLLSYLVYGVILAVPIANMTMSLAIGNALRVIVILSAAGFAIWLVVANAARVRLAIQAYAATLDGELGRSAMHLLGRVWAVIAILYTLVVLGIWITRPLEAIEVVVNATFFSIVTVVVGGVSSMVLTRAIAGGIRLPDHIKETLPALEGRVNAVVPHLLKAVRLVLLILTLAFLLEAWSVIDLGGWLKAGAGADIVGQLASAAFVILLGCAAWLAVMSWIDLRLRPSGDTIVSARERTLFQLFRNAFTVVVIVMTGMLTLSELGLDIGPLIAGAGVIGLAVSFGAQTLVKDIITGAFIQIENAINEGDVITVAGINGTVERLTVRSVRIRDINGTTHIIPFSSVDMVSNFMRDFSYHVAVIGVSYSTDIDVAKAAMKEAFDTLKASPAGGSIIGDLEMHGVIAFADSAVNLRARIKTFPGAQWATGRAYNEHLKRAFDTHQIDIPFPQVTYHIASESPVAAKAPAMDAPAESGKGPAGA